MIAPDNDRYESRRQHPRRAADNCVTVIDGKAYPVFNWSNGGILVQADERMFSMASPIEMTLKFRLGSRLLDIAQRGRVIRKTRDRLAIEFDKVPPENDRKFKQVIDDYVTRQFLESQMA